MRYAYGYGRAVPPVALAEVRATRASHRRRSSCENNYLMELVMLNV
jgi:hypothetical protein